MFDIFINVLNHRSENEAIKLISDLDNSNEIEDFLNKNRVSLKVFKALCLKGKELRDDEIWIHRHSSWEWSIPDKWTLGIKED